MSNDLISRKALIEAIKKWLPSDHCGKEQSIEEEVATDLSVSMMIEIEEAPTAYDVDAVCEKMDKASDYYETEEQGKERVRMLNLTDAVEIVKNGGKKE